MPHVLKNFVLRGTYLPLSHRRMVRTVQDYLKEAGVLHLSIALQSFLQNTPKIGWTTRCHLHTVLDNKLGVNDITNQDRKGQHQVTGVPHNVTVESVAPQHLAALLPKAKGAAVSKWADSSFEYPKILRRKAKLGIIELLEFYPFDADTGSYYMHCGCDLEHALLDFMFWKSCRPLVSSTTGASELLGNPVDPRTAYHYLGLMMADGVRVLDLYNYTLAGIKRTEDHRLPDHTEDTFHESIIRGLTCRTCQELECRVHEVELHSDIPRKTRRTEEADISQDKGKRQGDESVEKSTTLEKEMLELRKMVESLARGKGKGKGKGKKRDELSESESPSSGTSESESSSDMESSNESGRFNDKKRRSDRSDDKQEGSSKRVRRQPSFGELNG